MPKKIVSNRKEDNFTPDPSWSDKKTGSWLYPDPKYPQQKMDWKKFKEEEKITQSDFDNYSKYVDLVNKYSQRGILNLDLNSIKGTPEYVKVKKLIDEADTIFRNRYPKFAFSQSYRIVQIIVSILAILSTIIVPLVSESIDLMEDDKIKKINALNYLNILKKNKKLRDIIVKKPKIKDDPSKMVNWGKTIIDLIKK